MGVARFFRWIQERYPAATYAPTELTKGTVDNLYIDFNGIIHECFLRESHLPIKMPEAVLYNEIARYLDTVVLTISPRRRIFIAVDGVSPDAKIEQQRNRRVVGSLASESHSAFRSAVAEIAAVYDSATAITEAYAMTSQASTTAQEHEHDVCSSSVAISVGTCFMDRLHSFLIAYVARSVELEHAGWKGTNVTLSGWDVPAEGEHKIVSEIKRVKELERAAVQGPDCILRVHRQSHCVFGLDADLVLLGLGLHIPETYILRRWQPNMVVATKPVETSKLHPLESGMLIADLSGFREGLISEFLSPRFERVEDILAIARSVLLSEAMQQSVQPQTFEHYQQLVGNVATIKGSPHPEYVAALKEAIVWSSFSSAVIDDFIVMSLFVGNDFVPEAAGMAVKKGALDLLIEIYKSSYLSITTGKPTRRGPGAGKGRGADRDADAGAAADGDADGGREDSFAETHYQWTNLLHADRTFDVSKMYRLYSGVAESLEFETFKADIQDFSEIQGALNVKSSVYAADGEWLRRIFEEYSALASLVGDEALTALLGKGADRGEGDASGTDRDRDRGRGRHWDSRKTSEKTLPDRHRAAIVTGYRQLYYRKFDKVRDFVTETRPEQDLARSSLSELEKCERLFARRRGTVHAPEQALASGSGGNARAQRVTQELQSLSGTAYRQVCTAFVLLDGVYSLAEEIALPATPASKRGILQDIRLLLLKFCLSNTLIASLVGLHSLLRAYLRSLMWVVEYYFTDRGVPEWAWSFSYPFSPLLTDLCVYASMFRSGLAQPGPGGAGAGAGQPSEAPSNIDLGCVAQFTDYAALNAYNVFVDSTVDMDSFLAQLLLRYERCRFFFTLGEPRNALTAMLTSVPKNAAKWMLPRFLYDGIDRTIFTDIPSWDRIEFIPQSTAFGSLASTMSMRQTLPGFVKGSRFMARYTDGWDVRYSPYHKDYPLGVSDNLDHAAIKDGVARVVEGVLGAGDTPAAAKQRRLLHCICRAGHHLHFFKRLVPGTSLEQAIRDSQGAPGAQAPRGGVHIFKNYQEGLAPNEPRISLDYEYFYDPDLSALEREKHYALASDRTYPVSIALGRLARCALGESALATGQSAEPCIVKAPGTLILLTDPLLTQPSALRAATDDASLAAAGSLALNPETYPACLFVRPVAFQAPHAPSRLASVSELLAPQRVRLPGAASAYRGLRLLNGTLETSSVARGKSGYYITDVTPIRSTTMNINLRSFKAGDVGAAPYFLQRSSSAAVGSAPESTLTCFYLGSEPACAGLLTLDYLGRSPNQQVVGPRSSSIAIAKPKLCVTFTKQALPSAVSAASEKDSDQEDTQRDGAFSPSVPAMFAPDLASRVSVPVDQLLNGTPVLTYAGNYAGILYGFVFGSAIYARSFAQAKDFSIAVGPFREITHVAEGVFEELRASEKDKAKRRGKAETRAPASSSESAVDAIRESIHRHWSGTRGYVSATSSDFSSTILLMAPLLRGSICTLGNLSVPFVDPALLNDSSHHRNWITQLLTVDSTSGSPQYRSNIYPYAEVAIHPLYAAMLHYAETRLTILRTLQPCLVYAASAATGDELSRSADELAASLSEDINIEFSNCAENTPVWASYRFSRESLAQAVRKSLEALLTVKPGTGATAFIPKHALLNRVTKLSDTLAVNLLFLETKSFAPSGGAAPKLTSLSGPASAFITPFVKQAVKNPAQFLQDTLGVKITPHVLNMLFDSLTIQTHDSCAIEAGLCIRTATHYASGYFTYDHGHLTPTFAAVVAVLHYARALPYIFYPLLRALSSTNHRRHQFETVFTFMLEYCKYAALSLTPEEKKATDAILQEKLARFGDVYSGGVNLSLESDVSSLPLLNAAALGAITREDVSKNGDPTFRFPNATQAFNLVMAGSIYLHSYVVPLAQLFYVKAGSPALAFPVVALLPDVLADYRTATGPVTNLASSAVSFADNHPSTTPPAQLRALLPALAQERLSLAQLCRVLHPPKQAPGKPLAVGDYVTISSPAVSALGGSAANAAVGAVVCIEASSRNDTLDLILCYGTHTLSTLNQSIPTPNLCRVSVHSRFVSPCRIAGPNIAAIVRRLAGQSVDIPEPLLGVHPSDASSASTTRSSSVIPLSSTSDLHHVDLKTSSPISWFRRWKVSAQALERAVSLPVPPPQKPVIEVVARRGPPVTSLPKPSEPTAPAAPARGLQTDTEPDAPRRVIQIVTVPREKAPPAKPAPRKFSPNAAFTATSPSSVSRTRGVSKGVFEWTQFSVPRNSLTNLCVTVPAQAPGSENGAEQSAALKLAFGPIVLTLSFKLLASEARPLFPDKVREGNNIFQTVVLPLAAAQQAARFSFSILVREAVGLAVSFVVQSGEAVLASETCMLKHVRLATDCEDMKIEMTA